MTALFSHIADLISNDTPPSPNPAGVPPLHAGLKEAHRESKSALAKARLLCLHCNATLGRWGAACLQQYLPMGGIVEVGFDGH